ncbi:hypothetical protein [Actinomadura sp. 9N407]|uniref:hypothetical protein n=1 Tax=Actinomadura sp. 9N407 TaxID=3375154 RepID=UPI00379369A2
MVTILTSVCVPKGVVMASSYFSVRLSTLQHLGSRLQEVGKTVNSGATFGDANGAESYGEINSALGDFKSDWENATKRLVEKTGTWGQKTSAVGQFMGEHDQAIAAALRGEKA